MGRVGTRAYKLRSQHVRVADRARVAMASGVLRGARRLASQRASADTHGVPHGHALEHGRWLVAQPGAHRGPGRRRPDLAGHLGRRGALQWARFHCVRPPEHPRRRAGRCVRGGTRQHRRHAVRHRIRRRLPRSGWPLAAAGRCLGAASGGERPAAARRWRAVGGHAADAVPHQGRRAGGRCRWTGGKAIYWARPAWSSHWHRRGGTGAK